jgi:1-acyl-sn-glycerol-3-phosphate acyltransferase
MKQRSWLFYPYYASLKVLCWLVAKLYFRFCYSGREYFPRSGSVLLLSNHQSHLDPVLVGIASPRPLYFLARRSLFFFPLGWFIRSLGSVPVDREGASPSSLKTALDILKLGEPLVVFPEGTRSVDGKIGPLKSGFCLLARRSGATLLPVAIDGAFAAFPRNSWFPRPRAISLQFGRPISPEEIAGLDDEQVVEMVAERIGECHRRLVETS